MGVAAGLSIGSIGTLDDLPGFLALIFGSVMCTSYIASLIGVRRDYIALLFFGLSCLLGPTILGLGPLALRSSVSYWLHFVKKTGVFTPEYKREFNYDEVRGGILLGRQPRSREDLIEIRMKGTVAIVSLNESWELFMPDLSAAAEKLGMAHLHLQVPDFQGPEAGALAEAVDFIRIHASAAAPDGSPGGAKVYVHCNAGRGRSAVVTAAYLLSEDNAKRRPAEMWNAAQEVKRVVTELRSKRPKVTPNLLRYPITGQSRSLRRFAEKEALKKAQ
mmetsp:Transcript_27456/g.63473  ORF Transcript_27456/g.63473 Transcript_27456/m.63473 type:complete len:275 (+) Transcript_27456:76-900(+)